MDVSIAICTYNGALRVPDVLDALLEQKGAEGVRWEVLVVDNNSTDATAEVVRSYHAGWRADVPLRYVLEERQGKTFAIEQAVEQARGEWVAFLDDDNVPAADWVSAVHRFGQAHPNAGAYGGQIHGRFETGPPKSFGLVKPLFALNEREEEICYSADGKLVFGPPGAGLVVRSQAWQESVPDTGLRRKGPTGSGRGTLGEEFELQWRLYQNGWDVWHNPAMHLDHMIPADRFEDAYLEKFARAIGLSRHSLRMLGRPAWQVPFATLVYLLADTAKLVQLCWKYRAKAWRDRFVRTRVRVLYWLILRPFLFTDPLE